MIKNIDVYLQLLSESPAIRSNFIISLTEDLTGGFQEYICLVISRKINVKDEWSNEVQGLVNSINRFMSDKITVVKFKDREKALKTAIGKINLKKKIRKAKTKMMGYYKKHSREIDKMNFDEQEQLKNFFIEFIPKYKNLV